MMFRAIFVLLSAVMITIGASGWWDDEWDGQWYHGDYPYHHGHFGLRHELLDHHHGHDDFHRGHDHPWGNWGWD